MAESTKSRDSYLKKMEKYGLSDYLAIKTENILISIRSH